MVHAAAAPHRIFLQGAQAGDGLARIENAGLGASDGIDVTARLGRERRKAAGEKFSAQRSPVRIAAAEPEISSTVSPGWSDCAVLRFLSEQERGILFAEDLHGDGQAREDARLLREDARGSLGLELHASQRGDVGGTAVLAQRAGGSLADDRRFWRFERWILRRGHMEPSFESSARHSSAGSS